MLDAAQVAEVTEMIAEAAARAAVKALKEANLLSDADHVTQHLWVEGQMKRDEARAALYEELTKHVAKWGTVGVLSFVFYGLYLAGKEALKR